MGCPAEECEEGAPAWLATFADLCTLLMCFFVLLLSFAEMNVDKYKAVAGSMRAALGVSADSELEHLNVEDNQKKDTESTPNSTPAVVTVKRECEETGHSAEMKALFEKVKEGLHDLIAAGTVQVEYESQHVIIRMPEKGMFPPASARLSKGFDKVIDRLAQVINEVPGEIQIAGHTDDRPIHTKDLRSNWDLSAERAVTVLHELLKRENVDAERLVAMGYGDSRPLVPNTDAGSRAKNRRVEVVIRQAVESEPVALDPDAKPAEGAQGDTAKPADGAKGDGAKADGAKADDAKADGAKAGDAAKPDAPTPPSK